MLDMLGYHYFLLGLQLPSRLQSITRLFIVLGIQRHMCVKVLPKFIEKSCIATPHCREWTCPLQVLLSVQCSLQMNPVS